MRSSHLFVSPRLARGLALVSRRTGIPDQHLRDDRQDAKQNEVVKTHYLGAIILIAAAEGFLVFIFALDRVVDFSRFVY